MPFLRRRGKKRRVTRLRSHTVLRCPYNGHQVSFCRQLCRPVSGRGICGRQAPHAMIGRTQAAITAYAARKAKGPDESSPP